MPARIAGIQARRTRPNTSVLTWVPAIHAGTTTSISANSENQTESLLRFYYVDAPPAV